MDEIYEAYAILCAVTGHAARGALGAGISPEDVAAELESLANAIRDPGSVAESMYAIPQIPRKSWESIGVDFSEVE
jgi:hypothetical protein